MKIICNFYDDNNNKVKGVDIFSLKEFTLTSEMNIEYCRGFYIRFKEDLLGIIATGEGPVFFYKYNKYLLEEYQDVFLLERNNDKNVFQFIWQGKAILRIHYIPVIANKSGHSTWDFFSWLTEAVKTKRFYKFYTVSEVPALVLS